MSNRYPAFQRPAASRLIALLLGYLPLIVTAQAPSITGGTCVVGGTFVGPYTINNIPWNTNDQWCVSGGTVSPANTSCMMNPGAPSVGITWSAGAGSGTVSYYHPYNAGSPVATLNVSVLTPGGIMGPNPPLFAYNTPFNASFTSTANAVGCGGYTVGYQWQWQASDGSWVAIPGAPNSSTLTLTGISLTQSTNVRRAAFFTNGPSGYVYSGTWPLLVPTPGTLTPASQTVNSNGTPQTLSATAATNCMGQYQYNWWTSTDNTHWNPANTTGQTWVPPVPSVPSMFYRLGCTCTQNNSTVYTNSVVINVVAPLVSGAASPTYQAINPNTMTTTISSTIPSGGNGIYSYYWQYSPDGSTNWQTVTSGSGNGTLAYSPGIVSSTTYYRIATVSNGGTVYSNNAEVYVSPTTIYGVAPANNPVGTPDNNLNWILSTNYNAQGNVMGQTKKFFDYEGSELQTQNKVFYRSNSTGSVYTHVLATQPILDANGRSVAKTMAAPIDYSDFSYRSNFVQATNGTNYNYTNFDVVTGSNPPADLAIGGQTTRGTLGWYYSSSNYWEPYTPTSGYPFSREEFYQDGTGNVKKQSGTGEGFFMGSGRETGAYVTPVSGELANYLAARNQYFTTGQLGLEPTSLLNGALVTVSKDPNGQEIVSIADIAGNILMTARPGSDLVTNDLVSVASVPATYTQQMTITGGTNIQLNSIVGGNLLNIYLVSGTGAISLLYSGSATGFPTTILGSGNLVLVSDVAFTAGYINNGLTNAGTSTPTPASTLPAFGFFKVLADNTTVNITGGSYTLYDMNTEAATSLNAGKLNRGYYKIVAISGIVNASFTNGFTDVSYTFYNGLSEKVAEIAPNGVRLIEAGFGSYSTLSSLPFVSTFTYDTQGRMIATTSPDEQGPRNFIYRADGKIRFMQDYLQAQNGSYSYTNYDANGRIIETGQYDGSGVPFGLNQPSMVAILENISSTGGLTTGTKTDVIMTLYDVPDPAFNYPNYTQDPNYMGGQVSMTKRYSSVVNNSPSSANLVSQTWFSYDEEGKVVWKIKYLPTLGSAGYKTMDYFYDNMSRVIKKIFQRWNTTGETFVSYYVFDDAGGGNLSQIKTALSDVGVNNANLQAHYVYYLHGGLKRVELGVYLQGLDYTYTLQGELKGINNSNPATVSDPGGDAPAGNGFGTDAFGEVLDYYPGDYNNSRTSGAQPIAGVNTSSLVPTESYAGNIKAMSWYSIKPPNLGSNSPSTYVFNYDPKYQFIGATWGNTLNFLNNPVTFATTSLFQEKVIVPGSGSPGTPAYDLNGNILNLQRTDNNGNTTDQFIYHYANNNNQLTSITNGPSGATTFATYSYDRIGRETSEILATPTLNKYFQYDNMNRVTLITQDGGNNKIISIVYDEEGNRIEKLIYSSTYQLIEAIYYFEGVVYTQQVNGGVYGPLTPLEYPIDGPNGRLGTYLPATPTTGVYTYELTDHLGNVRAIIAATGTTQTAQDYYPFGGIIQPYGTSYRYGYQGQNSETDPETNLNNFALRMYNSRIGRWFTTDPKGKGWNPYMGMGNDPVKGIDKDGGEVTDGDDDSPSDDDASFSKDDIIFRNKNGQMLGKIITGTKPDYYITINTDKVLPKPLIYDLSLPDIKADAMGAGIDASFTDIVGGDLGFEFVKYLNGPNKGQWYGYFHVGANAGLEEGFGLYGFAAWMLDKNSKITPGSWTGVFSSYTAGAKVIAGLSASFFWSNNWNLPELYPNEWGSGLSWVGVSGAGPIGSLNFLPKYEVGAKISWQEYILLSDKPMSQWFQPGSNSVMPGPARLFTVSLH